MFGRLMPTEGKFFEIFNSHAKYIVEASHELYSLIKNPKNVEIHKHNICNSEKYADKLTHETMDLLHKTFITPLDRDQIYALISNMDDVLDVIDDVAMTVSLYNIHILPSSANDLAHICVGCCIEVEKAVDCLSSLKNITKILAACNEIDNFESEADKVMRAAISKLFREEDDVKNLIKHKAIYELLETVTDKCEDVANIIEGIVLENT